jgi:hypothetical protein
LPNCQGNHAGNMGGESVMGVTYERDVKISERQSVQSPEGIDDKEGNGPEARNGSVSSAFGEPMERWRQQRGAARTFPG